MAKELSFQHWVEDLLPHGFLRKPMFGGRAYYFNEKLILTIFESPGDRQYKDKIASYDIWNKKNLKKESKIQKKFQAQIK